MKRKHILIIEDDSTLAQMYRDRLEMAGFRVGIAYNGEAGISVALDVKPDLVLLDLMLPKKGGMNVLQVLKTQPTTKKIPVIVATALLDEKYRKQSLSDGAVAHFVKSQTTPAEIVKKIQEVLS